jgi:predicted RecA/RadA family phage recombinase
MAATIAIGTDKDLASGVASWRADGDTIPFVVGADANLGDVIEIESAQQFSGVVTGGGADYVFPVASGGEVNLRVDGLFWVKKAAEEWSIGQYVSYAAGSFSVNVTGAHRVIGGAEIASAFGLVQLNVLPRAAT